jgi:DNA-binding NarL/FixJ family response regulator
MDTIKVLIVDEQPYFRAGVAQALSREAGIEVVETDVSDGSVFITMLEDEAPDVVLLGSDLTNERGLELGRMIVRCFPTMRVVILSPDPNDEELFKIIRTSAVACVKKNTSPADLVDTLRRAVHGEYPINDNLLTRPAIAQHVLQEFHNVAREIPENLVARLTNRESQILNRVANGQSNKQIAASLDSTEQTVKNHISAILRKLNANDRTHAAVLAIRQGLIPLNPETGAS